MSDWPKKMYPGDTPDVGYDEAERLLEVVPADQRVYTLDEVVHMFDALADPPGEMSEHDVREWCEGHVEHMAAGGYVIGRPDK